MKFRSLLVPALTLLSLLMSPYETVQAQEPKNGEADSFEPSSAINEGIDLGKRKKLDQARQKFEESLAYWQVNPTAALYLKILEDVDKGILKKKIATNIFKRLKEDLDGKHEKALKEIRKIVKKNKGYFPIYMVQADLLTRADNYEEALESLDKAVDLTKNSALALIHRGKFQASNGERKLAIEDFTTAISRDSSSEISYFERGFAYVLQEKFSEAIADFEIATNLYPDWKSSTVVNEAYHNRGVKWIKQKKYKKAIADFDQAIRINPDFLPAYLNRGSAYRNLKQYSKAVGDFTHCIENDNNFIDAYYNRALTHYTRRHYKKAADDLVKAIELRPESKKMQFKLAESYYNLKNYKTALTHFNKVIQLDAQHYWSYYWKGFSLGYLRKPEPAIVAFRQFLKLAPKKYYKQISHAELEIDKMKRMLR